MPDMSSADAATDAARRLADALANPAPSTPFVCFGAQTMDAIRQLVYTCSASKPSTETTPKPTT